MIRGRACRKLRTTRRSGAGGMLTGDENIVDVDFSVFWLVKPDGAADYLFNIQQPEGTVKAVAESTMREIIGRSELEPILTGARQNIESAVQALMQSTLDRYGSGIQITQVQLQKVDVPAAGDRCIQGCAGCADRPGAGQERGLDLRQQGCPGGERSCRTDHAECRSLSRTDRRRGQRCFLAL
jgi:hypothetical protein